MPRNVTAKRSHGRQGCSWLKLIVPSSIPFLVFCNGALFRKYRPMFDLSSLSGPTNESREYGDFVDRANDHFDTLRQTLANVNNSKFDFAQFDSPCDPKDMTVADTLQAPDFIIAGAQKAGTSALYAILKKHPSIMSSIRFETHFFDQLIPVKAGRGVSNATDDELCEYQRRYRLEFLVSDQLPRQIDMLSLNMTLPKRVFHFEKTPVYFCLPVVPGYIKRIAPWTKILIILRNPVDRAYSEYKMLMERNLSNKTFESVIDRQLTMLKRHNLSSAPHLPLYKRAVWLARSNPSSTVADLIRERSPSGTANFSIGPEHQLSQRLNAIDSHVPMAKHKKLLCGMLCRGMYAQQLTRWMDHFTLGQSLLVIPYERFLSDRSSVLTELFSFLGVAPLDLHDSVLERSYSPRTKIFGSTPGPLNNMTRDYLTEFYKSYNDELADLLGETWRTLWTQESM